jgi:hypothetical protein
MVELLIEMNTTNPIIYTVITKIFILNMVINNLYYLKMFTPILRE